MHRLLVLCLLLLVACQSSPDPGPPAVATPVKAVVLALPSLLAAPQRWVGRSLTLIAPVATIGTHPVLVPGFQVEPRGLQGVDDPARSIWLRDPLPAALSAQLTNGIGYLKLRGELSPPGGYGTDGRYAYQFAADQVSLVAPQRTPLANLVKNRATVNNVLLQVNGSLLATGSDAILSEEITTGGVPNSQAGQIKLGPLADEAVLQQLEASGNVHYGPVEVIGWWQEGILQPFTVTPAPAQGGSPPAKR